RKEFEDSAAYWNKMNIRDCEQKDANEVLFSNDFISAFRTEFGLTPDEAEKGLLGLSAMAAKCNSEVVETSLAEIKKTLIIVGGLSLVASDAFVNAFC
ncbi:MAG: hypothetical protein ACXVIT_12130, partial [Halobacteriota archaeon]